MLELDLSRSLIDILDEACEKYADRECVEFHGDVYTYREVQQVSQKVAQVLQANGFKKGMHAAVYSLNSATILMVTIGIIRAGGVWIPVNPRNSEQDNITVIKKFGCHALFYQSMFDSAVKQIKQNAPEMVTSVCIDSQEEGSEFDRWLKQPAPEFQPVEFEPTDTVTIPQTGGTTGLPKGVMLSQRNFAAICYGMSEELERRDEVSVSIAAAPMTHVGGRAVLGSMPAGAKAIVMDKVDPQVILSTIQEKGVTDFFLPPTGIYSLLDQPNVGDFDFSSLRCIGYGSAPVSTERLKEALGVFGPVMRNGFGQTECPMFIAALAQEDHFVDGEIAPDSRLRSVGKATVISELGITDDDGNFLPANERGEIVVRGPMVSEGYYQHPEETAKIRRDGWHLTGDIGYLDEDGFLFIVDRKKDMIITGGFNVYSSEVENCVNGIEGVDSTVVIGVPDEQWGEAVKAVVKRRLGAELTEEAIITAAKAALGSVKAPKSVDFVDDFPKTPLGKIDKKVLRAQYWQDAGRAI